MHVHNNQFDPNLQLGALYATARAEAKQEAERVRNKLAHAASSLLGDYDEDCVVSLSGDEGSQQHPNQRDQQETPQKQSQPNQDAALFSDWA